MNFLHYDYLRYYVCSMIAAIFLPIIIIITAIHTAAYLILLWMHVSRPIRGV